MFLLHIISEELHFNFQSSIIIYQKTISYLKSLNILFWTWLCQSVT